MFCKISKNRLFDWIVIISFFLTSCNTTRRFGPSQKLYDGYQIKISDNDFKKAEKTRLIEALKPLIRPKPNSKILGFRYKLYIYEHTQTKRTKGLRHYLNTHLGEAPVFISSVDIPKTSQIIENRLQNLGYFKSQAYGDTMGKPFKVKVIYKVTAGPSFQLRRVIFPPENDSLNMAIRNTGDETFLKPGDKFNLDIIKNERIRIDSKLKEEGFYYFAPENLIIKYDSTIKGHLVDLFIEVKASTVNQARQIYHIQKIYVYPNYTLQDTALKLDSAVKYRWYYDVDPKKLYHPYTFRNSLLLEPGMTYSRSLHNNSLSRLVELGPFKFVKNRFQTVPFDSTKLDVYYFLTPYKKKSLQFEILGQQNSANYTTTQVDLTFRNRNLFKGAELLNLNLFASTDIQFGSRNKGYDVYQFGVKPSISWPRFISPFNFKTDNAFIPKTILSSGYTFINRLKLYSLNSFYGSFGYEWKPGVHKQNDFNLIEVNFVDPAHVTQIYLDSIKHTQNPALAHVIDKQFTFGPSFAYVYTNTTEQYRTNTIYYRSKLSLSGNLYGILTGADTLHGKVSKLFGTPFNQYLKLENEIRYFHKTSPTNKLVTRLMVDIGIPYGNSTILPYSQQFFIGGTNSLRGFQARSIGPGTYSISGRAPSGSYFLPDESGDIKLEGNLEYRPHLFSIVEGALFIEAGNIWLLHEDKSIPGSGFTKSFLSQLAADIGLGLRFNLSVLVLRTDLAFPIREPNLPIADRWVIRSIDFRSSAWRSQNLVFNLAIGYPF